MTCGKCGHAITGQSKVEPSGATFIYYHCANAKCDQSRKYTNENKLVAQLITAFEPFRHFTPKATRAFIEGIHASLSDFDLYTRLRTSELRLSQRRSRIKEQVAKLEKLYAKGLLSKEEYDAVMSLRSEGLQQVNINIACENEADLKLFEEGCRIIELLTKVRDFMTLSHNLLEKVRLAKLVLSNPKLLDGTLQFDYKKPFDDLIELVRVPGWWSRRELNSAIKDLN